jgi:hypothetical protein
MSVEAKMLAAVPRVHLASKNPRVPPPSPVALRIHSCIAKILHHSGIAEQLNELHREVDHFNIRFLSTDGSVDEITLSNSILLRLYRKPYQRCY